MPFVKGQSGNPLGRIPKSESNKYSKAEIRDKEFLSVLRKIKPHLAKAVQTAVKIMDDEEASETGKLRASALIIQTYKDLVKEVYVIGDDGSDDDAEPVDSPKAPIFSMTRYEDKSE